MAQARCFTFPDVTIRRCTTSNPANFATSETERNQHVLQRQWSTINWGLILNQNRYRIQILLCWQVMFQRLPGEQYWLRNGRTDRRQICYYDGCLLTVYHVRPNLLSWRRWLRPVGWQREKQQTFILIQLMHMGFAIFASVQKQRGFQRTIQHYKQI